MTSNTPSRHPTQCGEDNSNDANDSKNQLSKVPKAAQLRGVSAPLRTQKKVTPPTASCLPPFPPRGAGTMRCTSAPTTISSHSSYCCTKSGWKIADPSLGNMRFTDATFSALLRDSSVERANSARVFDSWGESGAPSPQATSLKTEKETKNDLGEQKLPSTPLPQSSSSSPPLSDTLDDASFYGLFEDIDDWFPEALTDRRGVPFCPTCNKCMQVSASKLDALYRSEYRCSQCNARQPCEDRRWWCEDCRDNFGNNFCFNCCPIPLHTKGDDPDEWECHLCHHKNGSIHRECEQCSRRRRGGMQESKGGIGVEELLPYDEYHKEKGEDKEIVTSQKKEIDKLYEQMELNKLLDEVMARPKSTINGVLNDWDPCHISSFGLSSATEAHLCLSEVTREVGYDLTPEEHSICRLEHGLRLPFIEGDTVKDKAHSEDYIGTVTYYYVDDNEAKVGVEFKCSDDPDDIEKKDYSEDHDDLESPFPFEIEQLVRRSPEEIWLRNDAAPSRDAMNGGGHPNRSSTVAASSSSLAEAKMQGDGDHDQKMPAENRAEAKTDESNKDKNENDFQCCICLENKPHLFSELCKKRTGSGTKGIDQGSSSCENMYFCRDCLQRHCEMTVADTRYSAGPVRCPGPKCGRRLPMELWHDLVSRVSLLQYIHAPRQLMAIRCPSCDNVRGLFPRLSMGEEKRRTVYKEIIEKILPKDKDVEYKRKVIMGLVEAWRVFSLGEATPEETIEAISNVCGNGSDDFIHSLMLGELDNLYYDMDYDDGNVDPLAGPPLGLLSLVCDVERRAALALALLRKDPFIYLNGCCYVPVCFKCKVDGHHEGQTCEERQAEEMEIEAQFCPQCGVPTIRSEGCDHIVCVCGAHWTWKE